VTAGVLIFALTYVAIAAQLPFLHLDRPAAALCGAVAMVAFGVLPLAEAYQAINLDTLALLLGMMVVAAYLMEAAFFRYTAWWVLSRMRSARTLLWALVFVSGGLSALLVNDTVCLMFTPLVLAVVEQAGLPSLPYLLALASASNIGGTVTFTGNPQNMLIGMAAAGHPGYLGYFALVLPIGAVCLVVDAALLTWMFRRELPRGLLSDHKPPRPPLDRRLAGKGLAALGLFVALAAAGQSLAGAAMTAATALMILAAGTPPKRALLRVDWLLLLFFAGLFVVVRGLDRSAALAQLATSSPSSVLGLALVTVVGSNLVSNVPFVLVALHWVPHMPDPRWGYIVLAIAATLAGNLTPFGSVANIIVLETAGEAGKVGFSRFFRYGSVLTLATLAVALTLVYAERALGW
jgi:Na+/H+ antiporter NhaD/arsenite permease-like protein